VPYPEGGKGKGKELLAVNTRHLTPKKKGEFNKGIPTPIREKGPIKKAYSSSKK